MSQITLLRNDSIALIEAEDLAFSEMVDRIKKRYRQLAEYLGVVCRVDLQTAVHQPGLLKVEKIMDSLLRELMSNDALVAMSLVSNVENGDYVITVNGHFQKKPWYKPEGLSAELVAKAARIGITIKANSQTGIKLSYDVYLSRKLAVQ